MNQRKCPKCGSKEEYSGYGYAAGVLGSYSMCENCNAVLELNPDLEGLPDDRVLAECKAADDILKSTWGYVP